MKSGTKIKRAIICLILALSLVTDAAPLGAVGELISPWLSAAVRADDYVPVIQPDSFTQDGYIVINSAEKLSAYCYYFNSDYDFYESHKSDKLDLAFGSGVERGLLDNDFEGLGSDENHAFAGTIALTTESGGQGVLEIKTARPLFNYVYDNVRITDINDSDLTLRLIREKRVIYKDNQGNITGSQLVAANVGQGECAPLFAKHVVHNENAEAANWNITVSDFENGGTYSGVIGVIGEGAVVNLNYTCNSTAAVENKAASGDDADVGAVVGRMESGASLTLSYSGSVPASITSANGSAGGIVGSVEGEATININEMPASLSANVTAVTNAGGFIGYATSGATINVNNTGAIISGTIKSDGEEGAAGGIFGYYKNTKNYIENNKFSPNDLKLAVDGATVYAKYCGGIFGILENSKNNDAATTFTITVPQTITFDTQVQQNAQANALALSAEANNALDALNKKQAELDAALDEKTKFESETKVNDILEEPAEEPADEPTEEPTEEPAEEPAEEPTEEPTDEPTEEPADEPAEEPTDEPAEEPAEEPTEDVVKGTTEEITKESAENNENQETEIDSEETNVISDREIEEAKAEIRRLSLAVPKLRAEANAASLPASAEAVDIKSGADTTFSDTGYFGGIAGKYVTDDLKNSLVLSDVTLTAEAQESFNAFGGAIGIVDGPAYVKANDVSINAKGTEKKTEGTYFGGLIGSTGDSCVVTDLGNFTLNTYTEKFCGGGVIGKLENGVLRISGTTDLSAAQTHGDYQTDSADARNEANYGQIVGYNNNSLVYALGTGKDTSPNQFISGWKFIRSTTESIADDLGTWGEVVRSINDSNGNVLTFDTDKHIVTIKAAAAAISSAEDFVKTALHMQLNQGTYACMTFEGTDDRTALLANTYTINENIDLSGTGITGLMRDGGNIFDDETYRFTGTITGSDNTIKLAIGEAYGMRDDSDAAGEGSGQIYRHQYNGLIARTGAGAVINSLTIDGEVNVNNAGIDGMHIGGFVARESGNLTLNTVTASERINYFEGANAAGTENLGKNIGGFVGLVDNSGAGSYKIYISGNSNTSAKIYLSGNHERWNTVGSAIGKITTTAFDLDIGGETGELTDSHKMDIEGVTKIGANSDGGGLIGYITSAGSYSDRTVTINKLKFDGAEVRNAASTNGGGFLGFAWLSTTANINNVTVTDGTISGAQNTGAMVYEATGKWTVNGLAVNGADLSGAGSGSLGMIVNRAYSGDNGLFLDVWNKGYTLASGITLPEAAVFDELAAYSAGGADKVVEGGKGVGVVSINMNESRGAAEAKVTDTGTYQNQLNVTNKANPNARYYYNVDVMNANVNGASTGDNYAAGQDLVLWSLSKYAASNISGEFKKSFANTLTGRADLTGLSYYPLKNAPSVTLSDLTLTFDYSGIYNVEASDNGGSDGYVRDPGDTGTERNQHYLMHSGLFIDQGANTAASPSANVITVSGKDTGLRIGGAFLETGEYKGAVISGTMQGKLIVAQDSKITLDNLTARLAGEAKADGYLLVNRIRRQNINYYPPEISINGLSAENYPTETATVAKSLMGTAEGAGLNIRFNHIKLDGRKAATDNAVANAAMDAAYGTSRSIFSDAIFFEHIYTDLQQASLVYNYTKAEDWNGGRFVTYGAEIETSTEYPDKERMYYPASGEAQRDYTNPVSESGGMYNDFGEYFLRYVGKAYGAVDGTNYTSREIRVNVVIEVKSEGCGTYNDPYIIKNENGNEGGELLEAIALFIGAESESASKIAAKSLTINIPKEIAGSTTIDKFTENARWCSDRENEGYHAKFNYNETSDRFESGSIKLTRNQVKWYLVAAYYKIEDSITLSPAYVGLGGTTANTAFRGVIVGSTLEGLPSCTITNESDAPLINVSNGSVVKDVRVSVNHSITMLEQKDAAPGTAYLGYNSQCQYYGGIIGEIMGGDNIIDNSYVTYAENNKITLTGDNGTIVPVGGYVGVVVFGGLIFKNMTATDANSTGLNVVYTGKDENLADNDKQEDWAAIYVNPIVGRVINGYAVNETNQFSVTEDGHYHDDAKTERTGTQHTLKNGTKHYSIADIDKSETNKLNVTAATAAADGTINVPNAQALFILSLITQSTAGTATDANTISSTTDNTAENSRTTDESGNVTIYQTRTITNNAGLSDYSNSLSYGTYGDSVYGMSHTASYSDVGTAASSSSDYSTFASIDTAAKTALPYIIRHYTMGGESTTTTTTTTTNTVEASSVASIASFSGDDPDGKWIYIQSGSKYLNAKEIKDVGLEAVNSTNSATRMLFTKQNGGENNGKYTIAFDDGATRKYIGFKGTGDSNELRKLVVNDTPYYFTVTKLNSGKWRINGDISKEARRYIGLRNSTHFTGQSSDGIDLTFYIYIAPSSTSTTTITTTNTTTTALSYPARCVTSTLGYYDINLTESGTYGLPDSFRGLGSVGNYNANYNLRMDVFDGNSCTIDEDIYLNKYQTDNYFNKLHRATTQSTTADVDDYSSNHASQNHGLGLIDGVVTKEGSGIIKDCTVTGAVTTEIYSNTYKTSGQEVFLQKNNAAWFLSVGGVCGFAASTSQITFDSITLRDLSVSGSCVVGGILGYSGLVSETKQILVNNCSADGISVRMKSSSNQENNKPRNSIGTLVGKCFQGRVTVIGDATNGNSVKIKSYVIDNADNDQYITAGGLVGFSGHGCESRNMTVMPYNENTSITVGGAGIKYIGGVVGCMQPYSDTVTTGIAEFVNTTIQEINFQGSYVGGLYGGKWDDTDFVPYNIIIDNCEVRGKSSSEKNSITAGSYAGGLIGWGAVKTRNGDDANIEIKDSKVSNYIISCTASGGASGGFVGYCRSKHNSITCYIHDSSIENCVIGGSKNEYAGGAVGKLDTGTANDRTDDNKLLGYNIKLDNVTSGSTNNGTWIGVIVKALLQTTIQFTGIAVYGNRFSNTDNVKTGSATASFVFADYIGPHTGAESVEYDASTHVEMPKYPYVNVSPQLRIGDGLYISSDGAATYSETTNGISQKMPMAQRIYNDLNDETNTRRYTTFKSLSAEVIIDDKTIGSYFKQSTEDDRITTFKTLHGITESPDFDDFAVIVITNQERDETTKLINQYIRLVTNTTTSYTKVDDSKYEIQVDSCVFDEDKHNFVIDSAYPSIEYTKKENTEENEMVFMPVASRADSLDTQYRFSLIDVQFKDPLDSNKIAYHLYVPVYLVKEIEITFNVSVKSGTLSASSSTNPYVPVSSETWSTDHYVDGLDTWITQYVRFTYSQTDLQSFLDNGDIGWAHLKKVNFVTLGSDGQNAYRLPDGTKLVLVDPNGGSDEAYYADIEDFKPVSNDKDWSLPFEIFKDSGKKAFEYRTISDILQGNVTITEVEDKSGNFRLFEEGNDNETDAVTFNNVKYVPEIGGDIKIKVNGDVSEDYYIMQYVPKPDAYNGELFFYQITTDDYIYTKNESFKSKVYKGAPAAKGNYKNVVVSDVFVQGEAAQFDVTTENVVISTENDTIKIKATTEIKVNNNTIRALLDGKDVYHSFYVTLNRYTETGVEDKIYGLDGGSITAECTVNGVTRQAECELDEEGHYINIITGNIKTELTDWFEDGKPVTIETTITLDFDGTMLENEFPRLSANAEDNINKIGVRAEVASNLAYEEDRLSHTSMTKQLPLSGNAEPKYFHRVISADVVLYYYSIDELDEQDYFGKMSDNYSRYGVNGFFWPETSDNLPKDPAARKPYMANGETGTGMRINAEASYNVIEIENDIKDAKYLRVTIRLQKKENIVDNENKIIGAKYTDVSELQKYLLGMIEVKCGNQTGYAQVNGTTAVIDIPKPSNPEDWDYVGGIFKLKVGFNVKTGEGFHEYANYKMYLDARMLGGTKDEITVSKSNEQYIVYTNAKVIPTFIYD